MLNKPQLLRRLLALCGLLLLCSGVALSQLFQLQILSGEKYVRRSAEFLTTTSTVSAARGEILDRYGRPLVTNNTGFSLVLIYSSFWDGNDKRFDTLLDLTHRIQTAAVDATAKQNAAKTAAATDSSSDTSADAADSTDTSSDTPTDTAQAVSADTAAIPSINDRLPITQSAPFTYNSASLTELSGYMKDSAKSLGLDAVTAAIDAAKQARPPPRPTRTATPLIRRRRWMRPNWSPRPSLSMPCAPIWRKTSACRPISRLRTPARWSASITACARSASAIRRPTRSRTMCRWT